MSLDGSKFVVNFAIEGPGKKDLHEISESFKSLNKTISGNESGSPSKGKGIMAGLDGGLEAMEKMGETGLKLIGVGSGILETWGHGFQTLIHKGSEFESLILRIQGSGKTRGQAVHMMDEALEITKMLPLTEMDAARIAQTFSTIHIDATKKMGASYEELEKKGETMKGLTEILGVDKMRKEAPRAVTVVGDMLAAMGHLGTGYQQQAIHEMMVTLETGKVMSKLTFAGLGGDLEHFKKYLAGAKDPAGRLLAFQKILSKRGALGLSQAAMTTWGGVMSNFKGIMDQFSYGILQPGRANGLLSQLTRGLSGLYDVVKEFFDSTSEKGSKFLGMLRETFQMVGGWMTAAAKKLGQALNEVMTFMGNHPLLMKFAAGVSFLAAGILVATGVFLTASAALGGLILTLTMTPQVMLAPLALLMAFPPILAAMVAGVALAAGAWAAWEKDLGGIKTIFSDISLVFDAVTDALEHWSGDTFDISTKTAQKLEERGLANVFLDIVNAIRQVEVFYHGFMSAFEARWQSVLPKFERAWDHISAAFSRVFESIGRVLGAFGFMSNAGEDAVRQAGTAGEEWGAKLGQIADVVATVAEKMASWFDSSIPSTEELIQMLAKMYMYFQIILGAAEYAIGAIRVGFNMLKLPIDVVHAALEPIAAILTTMSIAGARFVSLDFAGAASAMSSGAGIVGTIIEGNAAKLRGDAEGIAGGSKAMFDGQARMASAPMNSGDLNDQAQGDRDAYWKERRSRTDMSVPIAPVRRYLPELDDDPGGDDSSVRHSDRSGSGKQRKAVSFERDAPRAPINQTISLVLGEEVLTRVMNKIAGDKHEASGGHATGPHGGGH